MFFRCVGLLLSSFLVFAATDGVMPWVTHQPQFRSRLVFNNLGVQAAQVALKAVRPAGTDPSQAVVILNLDPFEQQVIETGDLFAAMGEGQGFSVFMSSEQDDVTGAFVVRGTGSASGDSPAQGNVVRRASASPVLLYDYMTVRQDGGYTGMVVINTGEEPVEVSLTAYQNGSRVGRASAMVAPNHPWAQTTESLFPGVSGSIYAVAEASQPLLGVAFLFNQALEPSMANARSLNAVPAAPDFEAQVSTHLGPTVAFDGFLMDGDGIIYGAGGWTQDHVVKIDSQGRATTIATGLGGPVHLIQDKQANLYVSEFTSHEVCKIDPSGNQITYAQGLDAPTSLAFDEDGHLWVANYGRTYQGHTISKIAPNGTVTTILDDPLILAPIDIFFHESGDLLIANQGDAKVLRASRDGQVSLIARLPQQGIGHMIYVNGVCYATAGNQIYKITLDGKFEVFAGTGVSGVVNGPASASQFFRPNGIWVTPDQSALLVSTATQGSDQNYLRKITLK